MEEDIQNYHKLSCFVGTPCNFSSYRLSFVLSMSILQLETIVFQVLYKYIYIYDQRYMQRWYCLILQRTGTLYKLCLIKYKLDIHYYLISFVVSLVKGLAHFLLIRINVGTIKVKHF